MVYSFSHYSLLIFRWGGSIENLRSACPRAMLQNSPHIGRGTPPLRGVPMSNIKSMSELALPERSEERFSISPHKSNI